MELPFELEVNEDFLHIRHPSGYVITPESARKNWEMIGELCERYGARKVLVEAYKPERRLDTSTAFESGRTLAENLKGLSVAMCFVDYEFDDLSEFFKTVAHNRGATVEFFNDCEEACKWLGVTAGEMAMNPHQ